MKKKLIALGTLFAICLSLLATDMVVKQKNGEIKKFNVDDVEEVFFEEKANIPNDSIVVDASETLLRFDISSDSTAKVTGLKIGGVDELIIPAKVRIDDKVYTVTSIKDLAFDTNYLGSVMIPSSITKLYGLRISTNFTVSKDNPAFSSLDGVLYDKEKTKVIKAPEKLKGDFVIPESVTSIGERAFYYCESLTSINIPENVTSIGEGAFSFCDSLKNVDIPDGVTSIGAGAFSFCDSLKNVDIPDGVTSIGANTFFACESLTSINIPDGVTSIGEDAFYGCRSLTSINIPETVTSIGEYAFSFCDSLKNVNIPKSVTSIGSFAFYNSNNLDVAINNSKNNVVVGEDAFEGCKSVTWLKE